MRMRRVLRGVGCELWRRGVHGSACVQNAAMGSAPSILKPAASEPRFEFFPSARASHVPRVTLLPGASRGIGKEVLDAMVDIFEAAEVPLRFDRIEFDDDGESLPESVKQTVLANGVAMKGPFFTPTDSPRRSMNVMLRTELELFCNVVHVFNIPGIETRHKNIDIVVIRENTEGEYSGLEHEVVPGVVESLKIITAEKSMRVAEYAFQYAMRNNRRKVTAVHKANIMKAADGLFLECCKEVSKKYPAIEFEGMIVDNACMQMTSKAQQFDVVVLPNLYGNIVGNIASGLVGGAGLFPGMNIGNAAAVFEQGVRHAATSIAGKNVANPTGTILGGCMMLRYLKMDAHATTIESAVMDVYASGNKTKRTPDTGGTGTTKDFAQAVISELDAKH
ncbi:Isocitrate dehydrogenase NAD subunit gamma, mitochondrial [Porphyridium purpureum]|uniref:Isocitrate dehydrogenase NAD subunit gamma, mitochondrial n=1 Tax=Porphyridium purpureum TaxID=35688 RepID=A0A5J4Z5G9_PORPP|nr:Isocitrate dehydrogenase NAD subunit gamma, mitochondrial [Porphyridium purpureum]|eukprot:POR6813..scf295_1